MVYDVSLLREYFDDPTPQQIDELKHQLTIASGIQHAVREYPVALVSGLAMNAWAVLETGFFIPTKDIDLLAIWKQDLEDRVVRYYQSQNGKVTKAGRYGICGSIGEVQIDFQFSTNATELKPTRIINPYGIPVRVLLNEN